MRSVSPSDVPLPNEADDFHGTADETIWLFLEELFEPFAEAVELAAGGDA